MFRKTKQIALWLLLFAAGGLVFSTEVLAKKTPANDPLTYSPVTLSNVHGSAVAINQLDGVVEIVGVLYEYTDDGSIHRAHYWMVAPTGEVLSCPLQTLLTEDPDAIVGSSAWEVNNSGVIVGSQWDGLGGQTPLLWPNAMSSPVELPTPATTVGWARATSINDAGVVIGEVRTAEGCNLVAWKTEIIDDVVIVGAPETILVAPTDWEGYAVAGAYGYSQITNSGYVCATLIVSSTDPEFVDQRAIRLRLEWDEEQVWLVPGSTTQLLDVWSITCGINEAGSVCGRCAPSATGGWGKAYVMTVAGKMLNLPILPATKIRNNVYSETYSEYANALNNASPPTVVGQGARWITQGTFQDSEKVPLRWDGEATVTDVRRVTDGSPEIGSMAAVNDAGWITARTIDESGQMALPIVLIPNR